MTDLRQIAIDGAQAEWVHRVQHHIKASGTDHVKAIIAAGLGMALAARLPVIHAQLTAIAGTGCEAASQRSYLRGQYDLLTELAGATINDENGREGYTMGYPDESAEAAAVEETAADETAETAADDEQAGADAAAESDE